MSTKTDVKTGCLVDFLSAQRAEVTDSFDYESQGNYERIIVLNSQNTIHQQTELKWYPGILVDEGIENLVSFFLDWGMKPIFSCGSDSDHNGYICFLGSHKKSLEVIAEHVRRRGGSSRVKCESSDQYNGAMISVIRFFGPTENDMIHDLLGVNK